MLCKDKKKPQKKLRFYMKFTYSEQTNISQKTRRHEFYHYFQIKVERNASINTNKKVKAYIISSLEINAS